MRHFRPLRSPWVWGLAVGGYCTVASRSFTQRCRDAGNPAGIQSMNQMGLAAACFRRPLSRVGGKVMSVPIPLSWRPLVYKNIGALMGMNLMECAQPLESYENFGDLFRRTLKDGSRTIERSADPNALIVPCDGTIANLSEFEFPDRVTQQSTLKMKTVQEAGVTPIKGATYRPEAFLGKSHAPGTRMQYAVIYLAPKDYHHFHAPCAYNVHERWHFPGLVIPVFNGFAKKLNDLFSVNERIVLHGRWKYGAMYYSAIGAYNVANIGLAHEPDFISNLQESSLYPSDGTVHIRNFLAEQGSTAAGTQGDTYQKGDPVGVFRLGSTVVLMFEAGKDFHWDVNVGDPVKMGQLLGHVAST